MFAHSGWSTGAAQLPQWNLLFARAPEPDLEFEEDVLEGAESGSGQPSSANKPPKRKGSSPMMWVLLLLLLGGGAYVAMDPDIVMDLLNPLLGEPVSTPPLAQNPPSAKPTTPRPEPVTPSPAAQPAPMESGSAPGPRAIPSPPATAAPAPTVTARPFTDPQFGEGQRVTIAGTAGPLILSQDAAGRQPGPSVKPGSLLIVLDGDLQATGWVYSVRTEQGAKGWVPERMLRLIP
ncbi:MAG: hypothetical protein NW703_07120 [Nitrospiraceae bacterium]